MLKSCSRRTGAPRFVTTFFRGAYCDLEPLRRGRRASLPRRRQSKPAHYVSSERSTGVDAWGSLFYGTTHGCPCLLRIVWQDAGSGGLPAADSGLFGGPPAAGSHYHDRVRGEGCAP
eukprot:scaffold105204_cov33-Phaeocystis_antarctica.AAC.1